jgi:hypothetical protein
VRDARSCAGVVQALCRRGALEGRDVQGGQGRSGEHPAPEEKLGDGGPAANASESKLLY